MNNVSLLLGAGFSIPLGYPSANALNTKLVNLKPETFSIQSDGTFIHLEIGEVDNGGNDTNFIHKDFFCESINYFATKFGQFNYEEYFDFLNENRDESHRDKEFDDFILDFLKTNQYADNSNPEIDYSVPLIDTAIRSINQAVKSFLVDSNGNQFYQDESLGFSNLPIHHGILTCIKELGKKYKKVDIHTLNHDVVFEAFNKSDYLNSELSDGFVELGSPYYYKLSYQGKYNKNLNNRYLRISQFKNVYNKRFNLYKLHSSIDYFPFHNHYGTGVTQTIEFVKTNMNIIPSNLYKEQLNKNSELEYFNCWINYQPDFLSGKKSKIKRYGEPEYFKKVFEHFENNLKTSEMLIIVGYGCNDEEVNNIIYKNFPIGKKPVYITCKNQTPEIKDFINKTKAKVIDKYVEHVIPSDIGL